MPASPRPTRLPYRKAWELLEKHEQERYHLARGIDIPLRPGLSNVQRYSIHNSRKHRNESRYSDVSAYDYTAVKPRGEFLHANVVGDGTGRWWVAAQAPLEHTRYTFFRALLDNSASEAAEREPKLLKTTNKKEVILIQLTGWVERGTEKACPYMPKSQSEPLSFKSSKHSDEIHIALKKQERKPDLGSVYSELEVSDGNETKVIHHYFFSSWPDHGVPEGDNVDRLRRLVEDVARQSGTDRGEQKCEVWVHCSAGVGRTGTFIALSSLFYPQSRVYETEDLDDFEGDPIAETIDIIRRSRNILVQAPGQLMLIYDMMDAYSAQ